MTVPDPETGSEPRPGLAAQRGDRPGWRDADDGAVQPPVFLERQGYRRRRLMDAAKLLPLLGAGLFAIPLLWPTAQSAGPDAAPVRMSVAVLYVFLVWGGLILASALFGWATRIWGRPGSVIAEVHGDAPQQDGPDGEAR